MPKTWRDDGCYIWSWKREQCELKKLETLKVELSNIATQQLRISFISEVVFSVPRSVVQLYINYIFAYEPLKIIIIILLLQTPAASGLCRLVKTQTRTLNSKLLRENKGEI